MGIALHVHEARGAHAPDLRDPPDVVPSQIHQHHVLGPVLLALPQLPLQRLVLGAGAPAMAGPRDGPKGDPGPGDSNQDLGRAPGKGALAILEEEHVGGGIQDPERAIDVEGAHGGVRLQPVRQHHLDDVPGADVLLRGLDGGQVTLLPQVASERHLGQGLRLGRGRRRKPLEPRDHLVDRGHRLPVRPLRLPLGAGVHDEPEPVPEVVEDQDQLRENEVEVGVPEIVRQDRRELLEEAHVVVSDEPDRASAERGEPLHVGRAHLAQETLQHRERILALHALRALPAADLHVLPLGAELDRGLEAQDGVAPPVLSPLEALEEKRSVPPVELRERGDRSIQIGQDLARHGY